MDHASNNRAAAKRILRIARDRWNLGSTSDFICDHIQVAHTQANASWLVSDAICAWIARRINHKFSATEYVLSEDCRFMIYRDLSPSEKTAVYNFRLMLWDELNAAADNGVFDQIR